MSMVNSETSGMKNLYSIFSLLYSVFYFCPCILLTTYHLILITLD